jgi:phage repressor protein C with HTH and peptisase S24 domain
LEDVKPAKMAFVKKLQDVYERDSMFVSLNPAYAHV